MRETVAVMQCAVCADPGLLGVISSESSCVKPQGSDVVDDEGINAGAGL